MTMLELLVVRVLVVGYRNFAAATFLALVELGKRAQAIAAVMHANEAAFRTAVARTNEFLFEVNGAAFATVSDGLAFFIVVLVLTAARFRPGLLRDTWRSIRQTGRRNVRSDCTLPRPMGIPSRPRRVCGG